MASATHRELARLRVQLALDRLRVQRSADALSASARRTLSHPASLLVPYAAGALSAAGLGAGPDTTRRPQAKAGTGSRTARRSRAAPVVRSFRLARTALRAWSRTAVARELLAPLVRALMEGRR